jgi:O-acetyl-ADP-ribose deacetylase (regulator of RNase III)
VQATDPGGPERRCFVIMPYGKKAIHNGAIVDFDLVYSSIIRKAIEGIARPRVICERSIDDPRTGIISENFSRAIFQSDVAIIDVSGDNPNVYYELGMRHALKPRVSVLIGIEGTKLPFDISGILVIPYTHDTPEGREAAIADIRRQVLQGLDGEHIDSPVHKYLPTLQVSIPDKPVLTASRVEFAIKRKPGSRIGYVTGALTDIRDIDLWVNSENTQMEMARPYDRSISSLIRYYGAVRSTDGHIKRDLIQRYLRRRLGRRGTVAPATVILTPPGRLQHWGVKRLAHVASVEGQPGLGYRPIQNVKNCITNTLEAVDRHNRSWCGRRNQLHSVLFPILGTGQGGGRVDDVLDELVTAALQYVTVHEESRIGTVYFLAYTESQKLACDRVLRKFKELAQDVTD